MKKRTNKGFLKRHLDKFGVGGSVFAALCCLGFPALLSILSAIGLGFLINDAILLPLLIAFLLVSLGGLYLGVRGHGSWLAFIVGAVSAAVTFVFIFVAYNPISAGTGISGLVIASLLNGWLAIKRARV